MTRIFISYSHDDEHIAQKLAEYLRKAYDHVWYDERLQAGETWWNKILEEINACDFFIFLMSNEAFQSKYCREELQQAQKMGKQIMPVKVRRSTTIPDEFSFLNSTQMIDMYGEVTSQGLNNLYASLVRYSVSSSVTTSDTEAIISKFDRERLKRLCCNIKDQDLERIKVLTSTPYTFSDNNLDYPIYDFDGGEWDLFKYYLAMRELPKHHFLSSSLEIVFTNFDNSIRTAIIDWERYCHSVQSDYYGVYEGEEGVDLQYQRLIKTMADVQQSYMDLVIAIRKSVPDFDWNKLE